jgi:hypothetical protein
LKKSSPSGARNSNRSGRLCEFASILVRKPKFTVSFWTSSPDRHLITLLVLPYLPVHQLFLPPS